MAGSQKDPVHQHGPRARPTESHTQQPVLTRTQTPWSCIIIPVGEPEGLAQGTTAGTTPALQELLPRAPTQPPPCALNTLVPGPSSSLVLVLPGEAPLRLLPLLGQHKAQLLVGGEGGQGAIHALAGLCGVPVALPA